MLEREEMLCFSLGVAMRRISKIYADALSEHQITPPQLFLLTCLDQEDGQKACDLAEKICLDASSLTGLLDRTEKLGLVERKSDPNDRRALRIYLTAQGQAQVKTLLPLVAEVQHQVKREFFEGYSDEEVATFFRMLRRAQEVVA